MDLLLLPSDEIARRVARLRAAAPADLLIADNATLFYLTGRVFNGWAYIPKDEAAEPVWFVRRPVEMEGDRVVGVRKPEDIPAKLSELGISLPTVVGLEMNALIYSTVMRLAALFPQAQAVNASPAVGVARSVKTPLEVEMMRRSGIAQERVYRKIPSLFTPGMTDYELDVAIEHLSRLEGCLGQFRISGDTMEFFMGNILTGENADAPSPYDFALGGAGMNPSLPVGATGEEIRRGTTVSVDVNGDYTGYMTDMTRVFTYGEVPQIAIDAHQCSIDIHREFQRMARPGVPAKELWEMAEGMAKAAGFERYFMGHRQKAGFCGHGVGIEINEMPVIAPRSRDILADHNTIALEPKFVLPHIGAVGIENTYLITADSAECLTNAPEQLLPLL